MTAEFIGNIAASSIRRDVLWVPVTSVMKMHIRCMVRVQQKCVVSAAMHVDCNVDQ